MKKVAAATFLLAILILICAAAVSAESLQSEIKWIDDVSGIKFITGVEKGTVATRRYTVEEGDSNIIKSIQAGLKKRGWIVGKETVMETEDTKITVLKATKKLMKIEVILRKSEAEGAVDVTIKGKSTASKPVVTKVTEDVGDPNAMQAGQKVMILDSNQNKAYKCNNTHFDINGSSNNFTMFGTCTTVRVNGATNNITIKGKVDVIYVLGSYNNIRWSKKYNPTKPKVTDKGQFNKVESIP